MSEMTMKTKVIGTIEVTIGLAIYVLAVSVELSWLAFCFGSIVIGVLLLIFLPVALLAPFAFISIPASNFLFRGLDKVHPIKK